jgi:hypothetical protein
VKRLSRRTLLKGAIAGTSVGLALPPLEAMYDDKGAAADDAGGPIFGVFFWANGLPWHAGHGAEQAQGSHPDEWTPAGGAGYTPSSLLAPLSGHQVSVATGLEPMTDIPNDPPGQGDGHMRGFMVALTSDRPRPEGFNHPSHTLTALRPSLDQFVAKNDDFYADGPPRFRSIVCGASEARFHNYGHWNAVSYNGPDSTNLPIMDAGQLYDLLFAVPADADSLTRRARLLDAVKADGDALKKRLGATDRDRLDAHLTHLDEIQRRLELGVAVCEGASPPLATSDLIEKTSTMGQLLAIALGCGLTRVFSFMLTSPASTHIFGNLGVADDHHKVCHDGVWQNIYNITNYQMQAFKAFLDEMAAVTDPLGNNLMDRLLIYGTSEYGEGWKHGNKAHVSVLRGLGLDIDGYGFNGSYTTEHLSGLLA